MSNRSLYQRPMPPRLKQHVRAKRREQFGVDTDLMIVVQSSWFTKKLSARDRSRRLRSIGWSGRETMRSLGWHGVKP